MITVALLVALACDPEFQSSGGKYGGGDFGGGGGSGSSSRSHHSGGGSSRSSGSSSDRSRSSSSSSSPGGETNDDPTIPILVVVGLVGIVGFCLWALARSNSSPSSSSPSFSERMDLSVLQIAIDWRARRDLQTQLERLAGSGDTASREGLARLLRETAVAMIRTEMSWLYAGAADHACRLSPAEAEAAFRKATAAASTKYREEKIRNVDGAISSREVRVDAHPHEGEGVVVVTLAVAARRELPDVGDVHDARRLRAVLEDLAAISSRELVAMEVIWSPAVETDRMSTAELETLYPELRKIDPQSIAGRVFCKFCAGPYAVELLKCPHCGGLLQKDQVS